MRKSLQSLFLTGVIAVVFLLSPHSNYAQREYYWDNPAIPYIEDRGFSLGVTLGQSDLWGDVGTQSVMDHYLNNNYTSDILGNLRAMGGFFVRYTHVPGISFRLGVNYGTVYATDKWNEEKALKAEHIGEDPYQRYIRNLDAHTNIWEGQFLFEFSPLRLSNWEFGRVAKMRFQPYLLMGVSGFHFNPKGTLLDLKTGNETLVDLHPMRTEGQGFVAPGYEFPEPYSRWSYAAVGGIGFKVDIGRALCLGLEYQLRYTFTDYLDDVSGRYIDPQHFDIGYMNEFGRNELVKNMADRSREILPGYRHAGGEFRGDPNNKDMFSTLSLMFFWKIDKMVLPWWK